MNIGINPHSLWRQHIMLKRKMLKRKFFDDESAVSEVVGTILILSITVVLFSTIFTAVSFLETPDRRTHIDMDAEFVVEGEDEFFIQIKHRGGKSLGLADTTFYVDINDGYERYPGIHEDVELSNGEDGVWSVGETVSINITDEFDWEDTEDQEVAEIMVFDDVNNHLVWSTEISLKDISRIRIRDAQIIYDPEWRDYAEQGEDVEIRARISTMGDIDDVYVNASTDFDEVFDGYDAEDEIVLERIRGNLYSVTLTIHPQADEMRHSVRLNASAPGVGSVEEYLTLNVGEESIGLYQPDLVVGSIDFRPRSPTHGDRLTLTANVYNNGAVNYTADWSISDDGEQVSSDATTFAHGPAPTEIEASFDVEGHGTHVIDVNVSTELYLDEDMDGDYEEDVEPENNHRTLEIHVDPHVMLVKDSLPSGLRDGSMMENTLRGLNLDYSVMEISSEANIPDDSDEFRDELNESSAIIWMSGNSTDNNDDSIHIGVDPVPDALNDFIEIDEGVFWLIGSNLDEVNNFGSLRNKLPVDSQTEFNSFGQEEELELEAGGGTYGELTYNATMMEDDLYMEGYDAEDEDLLSSDDVFGAGHETEEEERTAVNSFVFERIDDSGQRMNMASEVIKWLTNMTTRTGVDVAVISQDIQPRAPMFMDEVVITATIRNNGPEDLYVTVRCERNGGEEVLAPEEGDGIFVPKDGGTNTTTFIWEADELGLQEFIVIADYFHEIDQVTRRNNDITYKDLDMTDDIIQVNVHYSTLVVDADGSVDSDNHNVTRDVVDSFERMGHVEGLDYDYYPVAELGDFPDAGKLSEYNSILLVLGEKQASGIMDEGDIGNLESFLEQEFGANLILFGDGVLDIENIQDGNGNMVGEQFLNEEVGIDPNGVIGEESRRLLGDQYNPLSRGLKYYFDGSSNTRTFQLEDQDHVDILFRDEHGNNLASIRDQEPVKVAYMGFNISRLDGPLVDQSSYEDWPAGEVEFGQQNAIDELIYTTMWQFGRRDDRAELRVLEYDIELADEYPQTGRSYEIMVEIQNIGYRGASALVRVKEGEDYIGSESIHIEGSERRSDPGSTYFEVEPGTTTMEVTWRPSYAGNRDIRVMVDPLRRTREIGHDGEESEENKLMEFHNLANIVQPVYYFHDDMEDGDGNWRYDSTLMNIDGTGPLDFIDKRDIDTDVEGDWDWDLSGSTTVGHDVSFGEGEGIFASDNPAIKEATGGDHYSSPRSYWLPEGQGDPELRDRNPLDIVMVFDRGIESEQDYYDAVAAAEAVIDDLLEIDDGDDRVAIYYSQGAAVGQVVTLEQSEDMSEDDIKGDIPGWHSNNPNKAILDSTSIAIEELDDIDDERADKATSGIITFTDGLSGQDQGEKYTPTTGGQGGEPNQLGPVQWYDRDNDDEKGLLGIPYNIMTVTISEKIEGRHHWVSANSEADVSYGILERETEKLEALFKMFVLDLIETEIGDLRSIPGDDLNPDYNENQLQSISPLNNEVVVENTQFFVYTDAFTTGHLDDDVEYYDWKGGEKVPGYGVYDEFVGFEVVDGSGKVGQGPDNWVWLESSTQGHRISNTVYPRDTLDELEGEYYVHGAYANMYLETDGGSLELTINQDGDELVVPGITEDYGDGDSNYINIPLHDIISDPEPFDFVLEHEGGGNVIIDDLSFTYEIDYTPEDEHDQQIGTNNKYRFFTTPSVDMGEEDDFIDATLEFRHKYRMTDGTTGGFIYLWGRNETDDDWVWQRDDRLYVEPRGSYTGNLHFDRLIEEIENGGLNLPSGEDSEGIEDGLIDTQGNVPQWVFNGKSADGTFDWTHNVVELGKHEDFLNRHDEVRAVFVAAQFGGVTKEHGWEPEMGWYLDNVRFKVSSEWNPEGPGHWNMVSASELEEMGIEPDNLEDYYDHTLGNEDGHFWMFTSEEGGEDVLPKGVDSSLYTNRISLSNAVDPELSAYIKFNLADNDNVPPDGFRVEVSADDGRSWHSLSSGNRTGWGASGDDDYDSDYAGSTEDGEYGWVDSDTLRRFNADLSSWRGQDVIIRFRVVTNMDDVYAEEQLPKAVFIDDVKVQERGVVDVSNTMASLSSSPEDLSSEDVEYETSTSVDSVELSQTMDVQGSTISTMIENPPEWGFSSDILYPVDNDHQMRRYGTRLEVNDMKTIIHNNYREVL